MTGTPDAHHGHLLEDEAIIFSEATGDPAVAGELRYYGGSFKAKDSTGVFNLRSGTASVFGYEYQQGSSLALYTTSSGTFQQRWRFTTTSLPAGNYILFAFAEIGSDVGAGGVTVEAQIQQNDTVTLAIGRYKVGIASSRQLMGGAFHFGAISGVQNIDFDIRKLAGTGSVAMENARAILWRVS